MHDDEMVLGIDGGLHVVADNPGVLAAGRHGARIWIGQRDLLAREHRAGLSCGVLRQFGRACEWQAAICDG
jgi:hypothetical protein